MLFLFRRYSSALSLDLQTVAWFLALATCEAPGKEEICTAGFILAFPPEECCFNVVVRAPRFILDCNRSQAPLETFPKLCEWEALPGSLVQRF